MKTMTYFRVLPICTALLSIFPATRGMASTVEATLTGSDYLNSFSKSQPPTSSMFTLENQVFHPWTNNDFSLSTAVSAANGNFGASVSANKTGFFGSTNAKSVVVYEDVLTNNSGATQTINFDLKINQLAFTSQIGSFYGSQSAFSAKVIVNNAINPAWSTSYNFAASNLNNPTGPYSMTFLGEDLGLLGGQVGTNSTYQYGTSNYLKSLDLGSLDSGKSISVRYEVSLYTENSGYGGSSSIIFDDPAGLSAAIASGTTGSLGLGNSLHIAAAVPEPETYVMMAAGLGLVGGAARRQKRKQAQQV